MFCYVGNITLRYDSANFLVVQLYHRIGIIECCGKPIVEQHIKLIFRFAFCWNDLHIGDTIVLVESKP